MIFLLIVLITFNTYLISIFLSERFFFERTLAVATSTLLYIALPHQMAVIFGLLLEFGLINSYLIFITTSLALLVIYIQRNFRLVVSYIQNDIRTFKKGWATTIVIIAILAIYFVVGIVFAPSTIDELAYHLPQTAGAIVRDNLYSFKTNLPWVQSYPQGSAAFWSLFLWAGKSDLYMRVPQLFYLIGLLFSLAYILKKRSIDRNLVFLACFVVTTMPIVFILGTTNRADLPYTAYLIGMIATAYPKSDLGRNKITIFILLFLSSITIKIPILALIVLTYFGIIYFFENFASLRQTALLFFSRSNALNFLMLIVWIIPSSYPYISNFISYKNPFHPLDLTLFGYNFFEGSLKISSATGHTSFGILSDFSIFQVWHAVFYDFFSPLNEDSYGAAGLIFGFSILFCAYIYFFISLTKLRDSEHRWGVYVSLFCFLLFIFPSLALPRYHLVFTILLLITALSTLERLLSFGRLNIYFAMFILTVPSIFLISTEVANKYFWVLSNAGHFDRGKAVHTKHYVFNEFGPAPTLVEHLRRSDIDNIYYCGDVLPGLLWNSTYTRNLIYFGDSFGECNLSYLNRVTKNDLVICDVGYCPSYPRVNGAPFESKIFDSQLIYFRSNQESYPK